MNDFGGSFGAGRFSRARGRIQGSQGQGINYPSPFFDIAHTYLPTTVKQMFRWCRYYFFVHPLINAVIFKMSQYPITDLMYFSKDPELKHMWKDFLEKQLMYRSFQEEVGLDYYCLAGHTLVPTSEGVFPIKELAGKEVDVLSEGGVYRKAKFRSHGVQELWEVHTDDGILYATADHEWPVFDWNTRTIKRKNTRDLKGKSLIRTTAPRPPQNAEFWIGVRHGVIFGDGTLSNEDKQAHVCLYSPEKKELAKYFESYTITPHKENKYLGVYGLPSHFKQMPADTESASYWYGFVCGLLATDGSVAERDGQTTLTQKSRSVLIKIREQLVRFGMVGGRVREHWAWNNLTKQREPMNYLVLKLQYMTPADFVRPDQRRMFEQTFESTEYGRRLRVKKVVPTERFEEVFCCVEPETHSFVIENSILTGNCYGNALISIFFPFKKMLECKNCKFSAPAKTTNYYFRNFQFYWQCPRCQHHGEARVNDNYLRSSRGVRLLRWNPEDIDIRYNDLNGEYTFYYEMPVQLKNDIIMGKKNVVEEVPQIFIEALQKRKAVVLSRDNVYHFKRPTLAGKDRGWGIPLLLPVLKDAFYLQVMKKAQEAIMLEHIVPLRILFPQAGSSTSDPYTSVNLGDWKDQIGDEINKWRCVSPDSFVETKDGLREAGTVDVGEYLKNRQGVFERVLKRHERPLDPGESAYRLKIRGQHAIQTVYSEEHPIWAAKKINNGNGHKLGLPDFIRVDALAVGDYVGYPIVREIKDVTEIDLANYVDRAATRDWVYVDHTCTDVPEAFEYLSNNPTLYREDALKKFGWGLNSYKAAQAAVRENRVLRRVPRYLPFDKELAYVLGIYAAEGNTTPKQVFFSLHKDELDIARRLDRFFMDRFGASRTGGEKSENGVQYAYSSVIAAQLFHSLLPGTAINKRLPEVIREASDSIALEAVRGVLDGDGSYYEDKTFLGVSSRQLAEDVRQLFLSWQIMPGISYTPGGIVNICGKETTGHGCYRLQVSGDQHARLIAMMKGNEYKGSNFCKLGLFKDGFAWFRIEAIEEADPEVVVAFQMEGDSTFCTWGVATHNSDNNYIPILPLPVGQQTIGGDGRALLLGQEIRVWSEQIVTGMGVPQELVFGGLSYSGSNVSLRMLENFFLGYMTNHYRLLRWVMGRIGSYMNWTVIDTKFKPFKMADDLQRKAYNLQLNQAGKISDSTLLADADFDSEKEDEAIAAESNRRSESMKKGRLSQAEIEGEAQMVMTRYQLKAQQEQMQMQQSMQPAPGEPGAEAEGIQEGGMPQPMTESQAAQQQAQPGAQQAAPQMPPALPTAMAQTQSPLTLTAQQPPPASPEESGSMNVDLLAAAQQIANYLVGLDENSRQMALANLQQRSPELYETVVGMLNSMTGRQGGAAGRPLPEQRSPMRSPGNALI